MKKIKMFRSISCIMLCILLLNVLVVDALADTIISDNDEIISKYNLDTHGDDPVRGKMDKDDFDNQLEW